MDQGAVPGRDEESIYSLRDLAQLMQAGLRRYSQWLASLRSTPPATARPRVWVSPPRPPGAQLPGLQSVSGAGRTGAANLVARRTCVGRLDRPTLALGPAGVDSGSHQPSVETLPPAWFVAQDQTYTYHLTPLACLGRHRCAGHQEHHDGPPTGSAHSGKLKPFSMQFRKDEAKPERRPKSEARMPEAAGRVLYFGLRISFGFRVSDFALITTRASGRQDHGAFARSLKPAVARCATGQLCAPGDHTLGRRADLAGLAAKENARGLALLR